jgi:site-specific recombinase XerD
MDEIVLVPNPETQAIISANALPADQNAALVYLSSLSSAAGRRTQAQVLRVLADWMGGTIESVEWGKLRYQHTAALRTKAVEAGYSPASRNKFTAALRGVLKNAWRLGQMGAEDYQRASDLGTAKGTTLPAGRYIKKDEIRILMAACARDHSGAGVRDAAMIGMMYFEGVRREEIVGLDLADYNPKTGETKIKGKGNKERIAYLTNGAALAMADWLTLRGDQPGALFLAIYKNGKNRIEGSLSAQAVYNMIAKRIHEAHLTDISPHDFRRTCISDMLEVGNDLSMVSSIVGHSNPQTTKRYDRRPDTQKRVAAERMEIPYISRFATPLEDTMINCIGCGQYHSIYEACPVQKKGKTK